MAVGDRSASSGCRAASRNGDLNDTADASGRATAVGNRSGRGLSGEAMRRGMERFVGEVKVDVPGWSRD